MMSKMRSIFKELLIGAMILFVLSNIISYLRQPKLDTDHLPKIEAKLLDGTLFKPLKGRPLVVHFWATWCPTCKLEASNIQRLSEHYEVLTIAVNSGENEKIKVYMADKNLNFKVINDNQGKWATRFKIEAYPTTFIYDAKGELKFTEVGYTTTAGLLARLKLIE